MELDGPSLLEQLELALTAGDLPRARALLGELRRRPQAPALQLAAEVLHELRQPLLALKGYAQLIREDGAQKLQGSLMLGQIERMEQIISDFHRLASDRPAPKNRLNLAEHAREAQRQFLLNPDSARVQLELDIAFDLEVIGNGRLIEQLILNLLNNARDAMSKLGKVKLVLTRDGAHPTVYVADWGPGIPEELRPYVFQPYRTSKTRGSGLGLAVCERIAHEHGAQIDLAPTSIVPESPPPATVFRVRFPPPEGEVTPLQSRRVLVVDDERIILLLFRDLIGKECELTTCETGEEAVQLLKQKTFDLIVTDKNLPGISGLELAQEARRMDADSRVMIMTGYPSLVTAQQALELGVVDYLLKPFDDIREVRGKIRAALSAPLPTRATSASRRVDVYEDNPASAGQIAEALALLGLKANIRTTPERVEGELPLAIVVSWDFTPASGKQAVALGKSLGQGVPFIVLAEHLTMESTLESLRAGAVACLPKVGADVRALSRAISRALKVGAT